MNNRALRVQRAILLSNGIRSGGIIIDICARKYVYVFDVSQNEQTSLDALKLL